MNELKQDTLIEIKGKTVDEAINKGLKKLGLSREEVEIKILDEGASGLFGLMGTKPAKVKLQRRQQAVAPSQEDEGIVKEIEPLLKEEAEKLLRLMYFKNIKINIRKLLPEKQISRESIHSERLIHPTNEIRVEINSDNDRDISLLIGRNGKSLSALELLLQTIVNHCIIKTHSSLGQNRLKITVDVNRYYERKIEKAMEQVTEAMHDVKKTGRSHKLEPMPARIRRFIHKELETNPEIETISEGEGNQRRIVIKPK